MNKTNNPITVIHVASGDLWAGAEVQLYYLAKELHKNKKIRLTVVLLNHGILERELRQAGIPVTVFDEKTLGSLRIFLRLRAFMKAVSPHIVHTHRQKENVLGSFSVWPPSKAKSLRTVHGSPESKPRLLHIHKQVFRMADRLCGRFLQTRVVAVSQQLADQLSLHFPAHKIRIIENGIDVEAVRKAASEPIQLPGPAHVINIAIVGRLVPVKRVDIFLQVAHTLAKESEDRYAFYIFGDGPLRDEITSLLQTIGLERRVFMMGFQSNIAVFLSKMNFLLITSDHEGLPMNLLEALSLRLPVIAHSVGGIPMVLDNGKCGVLVTENSPESYAGAIRDCLSEPDLLNERINNGYQRLLTRYTSAHTAKLYAQLYIEMLSWETSPGDDATNCNKLA